MVFIIQIYPTSYFLKTLLLPMIFLQVEVSKNIPFLSAIVKLQGVGSPRWICRYLPIIDRTIRKITPTTGGGDKRHSSISLMIVFSHVLKVTILSSGFKSFE